MPENFRKILLINLMSYGLKFKADFIVSEHCKSGPVDFLVISVSKYCSWINAVFRLRIIELAVNELFILILVLFRTEVTVR